MRNTGFPARRRSPLIFLLTAFVILLVVVSLVRGANLFQKRVENYKDQLSLEELWEENRYTEIAQISEDHLKKSPLNADALLHSGYSHFYLAVSRLSTEEKLADLERSLKRLRLLKALGKASQPQRVDYILGKVYLLKGPYWADLAVEHLKSSLDQGYTASDSYEFLGQAYSSLGEGEEALSWYEKAAESNPTDRLFLTLGREAFRVGLYEKSESYYLGGIEQTQDEALRKKGLSELADLYYNVGNYARARDALEKLAVLEPDSPEIHFLLGETYLALGDTDAARRSWFSVTKLDPRHRGALHRLYD